MVTTPKKATIETLKNTNLPAGHVVIVKIDDSTSYDQVLNNVQAINELPDFTVIGVTSLPKPPTSDWHLDGCTYENGVLTPAGKPLDFGTPESPLIMYGYHASIKANIGDTLEVVAEKILNSSNNVHSGARLQASFDSYNLGGSNIGYNNTKDDSNNGFSLLETLFQTQALPVKYSMKYVSATEVEHVITSMDGLTEIYRNTQTITAFTEDVYFNFTLVCENSNEVIPTTISVLSAV
ncbi:hypothetical protein [Acinetobacter nosocomialis]|uniref:hypothetical protein n=1 Tax=Acinetobacter nosocomialis TaxID=106654 RepID=UPI00237EAA5A|nr:hypothetical protein [Acinetobacter nosocomialis]MDE1703209.1 hypothetical protein [Acinetobacter nosocomialis]HDG7211718.1 hypothetical protein [Acinetobacter nosocomialis]